MAYVVLDKKLNLYDFSILFEPIFQKSPLIKIDKLYVNSDGSNALLLTIVMDWDYHYEFFIELITDDNRTTIRLHPLTDTKKTEAVKQSLAYLALEIQNFYPDFKIVKSNLWNYLKIRVKNEKV